MVSEAGSRDSKRHLADIQQVTDAALARMRTSDLLDELLDRVREILGVDTAAVLLLDPLGERLVAVAAKGLEEEVRQGVQIPVGKGFAGRIAAQRKPVILEQVDHDNVLNPLLRERGITSLLGVPLLVEGRSIGVLHVGSIRHRLFGDSDAELLQMVGDRIALAMHFRESEDLRAAANALQRSVLPAAPPAIGGIAIAARYAPGEGEVGGDWYDVFELPSGNVALTIGDVAGKGLQAATVMARARSVLRSYAVITEDPATVLSYIDEMFVFFEPGAYITMFFGVLNPNSGALHYSSAGHLMPVLARPDGYVEIVEGEADPPIGIIEARTRRASSTVIPIGGTLYLFTDGLVERRDRPIDEGLRELKRAARAGEPEQGCVTILGAIVGRATLSDDFALLGVHRIDPAA